MVGEARAGVFLNWPEGSRWPHCGSTGIKMHWKGRGHVFQPTQFESWKELFGAVETRLKHAGLRMVEVEGEDDLPGYWVKKRVSIRVLVERTGMAAGWGGKAKSGLAVLNGYEALGESVEPVNEGMMVS